jgi:hypothetical protein
MLRSRPKGFHDGPCGSLVGDQKCLSFLRLLIEETRTASQRSRAMIVSTRASIAMLNRAQMSFSAVQRAEPRQMDAA